MLFELFEFFQLQMQVTSKFLLLNAKKLSLNLLLLFFFFLAISLYSRPTFTSLVVFIPQFCKLVSFSCTMFSQFFSLDTILGNNILWRKQEEVLPMYSCGQSSISWMTQFVDYLLFDASEKPTMFLLYLFVAFSSLLRILLVLLLYIIKTALFTCNKLFPVSCLVILELHDVSCRFCFLRNGLTFWKV